MTSQLKSFTSNLFGNISKTHVYTLAFIALSFLVLFSVFVRAPFAFQDEQVHYVRALGVSNGELLSHSPSGRLDDFGHNIDKSQSQFIDHLLPADLKHPITIDWVFHPAFDAELSGTTVYRTNTTAAAYSPVPYLPAAIGARTAALLGFSVQHQFIMMRLFGGAVSLIVLFLAFKFAPPKMRWVVLSIALLPISVAIFAAISADSLTLSVSLLFMAWTMRVVEKIITMNLQKKDLVIVGALALLVTTMKMPAFLLVALIAAILIVFRRKLETVHRVHLIAIFLMSAAATLAWAYYAKDINTGAAWGRDVDTGKQLHYIASEPLQFLGNLLRSILCYNYLDIVLSQQYADSQFFAKMPWVVEALVFSGLFLSPFVVPATELQQKTSTHRSRLAVYRYQIILLVLIVIAIFTLLYLQFTPIGVTNVIAGVQPRYFVPYLALLFMSPIAAKLSKNARRFAYAAPFVGAVSYFGFLITQLVVY